MISGLNVAKEKLGARRWAFDRAVSASAQQFVSRAQQLRNLIVKELGHTPSTLEILPGRRKPTFTYRIDDQKVQLWIGGTEVRLPQSDDVHRMLENLCATPTLSLTGQRA